MGTVDPNCFHGVPIDVCEVCSTAAIPDAPAGLWAELGGAVLLDDVHAFLRAYVAFPSPAASVAVTLWAAHTHMVAAFESTPRLALLSPEKRCGKTRVLELLELVCVAAERLNDASPPYMFRRIADSPVTIMLDEADTIWKRGPADPSAEALRNIVNAGHRKGSFVGRVQMTGHTAELARYVVYGPVALAGIGDCLPGTILDRAVVVQMRRRAPDEPVADYRERITRPQGEALRDRLAQWSARVASQVGKPWPQMPAGVTDRAADVWEPLLAVADLAGGNWPAIAREACVSLTGAARDETVSIGVQLLTDLYAAFHAGGVEAVMSTELILRKLWALEESPWRDWYGRPLDARGLARLLKPFSVRSTQVRIGEANLRGYRRDDLWDAWRRYGVLPSVSATSATSAAGLTSGVADVADVADRRASRGGVQPTLTDSPPTA